MKKIIGVRFRGIGKTYYFDPLHYKVACGDRVIVETARGIECGEVSFAAREVEDKELNHPLKSVIRMASQEDLDKIESNRDKEKDSLDICMEKIAQHGLEMKIVDVEYAFDASKIVFYFTADGRVDFRELVKDLASVFKTRIELRQIGVRDESRMLGGIGICGRQFCCSDFLFDFSPVSIKMAKEQGMSINPAKISGSCGRLMCCLKFEEEVYDELIKISPKNGEPVQTPDGSGIVEDVSLLTGEVKVRMNRTPDAPLKTYHRDQLKKPRSPQAVLDKRRKSERGDRSE